MDGRTRDVFSLLGNITRLGELSELGEFSELDEWVVG